MNQTQITGNRTQSAYFNIDSAKLAQVTALVPHIPTDEVAGFVLGDWPEGQEHQDWLDSASAQEIADWVDAGYEPDLAETD